MVMETSKLLLPPVCKSSNTTKQFGKDPSGKRDNKSKYKNDKNFIAKMTISEREKMEMSKMVDEMLAKRSKDNSEVQNKETTISKMLKKNIEAITTAIPPTYIEFQNDSRKRDVLKKSLK